MNAQKKPYTPTVEVGIRSEEVADLLGSPPAWILRWGLVVVSGLFGMLTLCSLLVRSIKCFSGDIAMHATPNGFIGSLWLTRSEVNGVHLGAPVQIVFDQYNQARYGYLRGIVATVVPTKATTNTATFKGVAYQVWITLPARLQTTKGVCIPFCHIFQAHAQIVTENISMFKKITNL